MSKYDIRRDFEYQNRILNVKTKIEKRKTNNEKRKANNEKRKTNNEKRKTKNEKQTNFTLLGELLILVTMEADRGHFDL